MKSNRGLNYLDLFSGIGGFRLGLEMAGFEFNKTYHSDIEEYPNKIYKQHWPDSVSLGDITKIDPESLGKIDIVTGGFPCQDISVAGEQKGFEYDGEKTRSGLYYEIIRLCGVLRPKIILLENVANLLTHNGGRTFGAVLSELAKIGYDAEWEIISAKDVGARHLRKRIWIVAYCNSRQCNGSKKEVFSRGNAVGACCEVVPNSRRQLWGKGDSRKLETHKKKRLPCELHIKSSRKGYADKWSYWNSEPSVDRVANGIPQRSHRLKGLGNAVVPQVVELIGKKILESGLL